MCKRRIKKALHIFVHCKSCSYTYLALCKKCPCCGDEDYWY